VFALPMLLPQNKPTPKKDGSARWRDRSKVAVNRRIKGCCK
jgi:hypothetical protein